MSLRTRRTVPYRFPSDDTLVIGARTDNAFYHARTDRNIGWLTHHEQSEVVRNASVSIAGVGGMGGLIAAHLVRLGIGTLHIADPEVFDPSNVNRQFAARRDSIGRSKALETARELRRIADDFDLWVFPQGVRADMLDDFLEGTDLIFDEIEFWNIGSCILLHQAARVRGIPLINCLTVGFATILHYFPPDGMPVEELLGLDVDEALELERTLRERPLPERRALMERIFRCFIPDGLPQYFSGPEASALQQHIIERLAVEGKASILATNPLVAAGFAANQGLLLLLALRSTVRRDVSALPPAPAYICFDTARLPPGSVHERAGGSHE